MYFDEFQSFAKEVSSELVSSIFDEVYHKVPCVKNFLRLRMNFRQQLESMEALQMGIIIPSAPNYVTLMPPVLEKTVRRFF